MDRDRIVSELVDIDRQVAALAAEVVLRPALRPSLIDQARALEARFDRLLSSLPPDARAHVPIATGDTRMDVRFVKGNDEVVSMRTAHVMRHAAPRMS